MLVIIELCVHWVGSMKCVGGFIIVKYYLGYASRRLAAWMESLVFLCYCAQTAHTRVMKIGSSGKGDPESTCKATSTHSLVQTWLFFLFADLVGGYLLLSVRILGHLWLCGHWRPWWLPVRRLNAMRGGWLVFLKVSKLNMSQSHSTSTWERLQQQSSQSSQCMRCLGQRHHPIAHWSIPALGKVPTQW